MVGFEQQEQRTIPVGGRPIAVAIDDPDPFPELGYQWGHTRGIGRRGSMRSEKSLPLPRELYVFGEVSDPLGGDPFPRSLGYSLRSRERLARCGELIDLAVRYEG